MELTNIVVRIGWNDTSDSGFCQKFRKLVIRTLNYGEPIARYVIETASNAEQYGAGAVLLGISEVGHGQNSFVRLRQR